jgi:hypothetical protein
MERTKLALGCGQLRCLSLGRLAPVQLADWFCSSIILFFFPSGMLVTLMLAQHKC